MKRKFLRKTGALLLALSMVGSGMCYVPAQVQAEETSTEGNVIDGYDVSKEYTVSRMESHIMPTSARIGARVGSIKQM